MSIRQTRKLGCVYLQLPMFGSSRHNSPKKYINVVCIPNGKIVNTPENQNITMDLFFGHSMTHVEEKNNETRIQGYGLDVGKFPAGSKFYVQNCVSIRTAKNSHPEDPCTVPIPTLIQNMCQHLSQDTSCKCHGVFLSPCPESHWPKMKSQRHHTVDKHNFTKQYFLGRNISLPCNLAFTFVISPVTN